MVRFFRFTFLAIIISMGSCYAQTIVVKAATDTTSYKVGDYIKYQIELRYDKNIKPELPPVKDSIKVLEFIQALKVDSTQANSKIIQCYNFIFSKYDSGQVTIPSLRIFYTEAGANEKKFLLTNPITITVHTLQVNTKEEIRDVKEPMTLPLNWWLIGLIVLIAGLLCVGGFYLYKYWKKKKSGVEEVKVEIKIPPYELALIKLDELDKKKLWQQGKVKEYHSEVTEIVRQYFEDRFNFRALEMPSSEILPVLNYLEDGKKIVEPSEKFFTNADLVKFAKFEPMPQVNEEMMKQAYEIVKLTIPAAPIQQNNGDSNVR